MVKAFHDAGLEVILDVVYNHTAEGGAARADATLPRPRRPRLLPPSAPARRRRGRRHLLGRHRLRQHRRLHQPARAAADPRLAALLGHRDARRRVPLRPRFGAGPHRPRHRHAQRASSTTIGQDPVLRHVKLIAEPWDASMDGYRVGRFPPPWVEWNDQYRDTIRDFWRGHSGGIRDGRLPAGRLLGPVRRRRALAVRLGQLRDRPRRLHPARPGLLRPQAQRGQRRGQPRRHRQQPVLEPRRRGRDRRPEVVRAAPPAGGEPDGHALPVQRRADDHRRRRARPHPAGQQQRLHARTTRSPGSTGGPTTPGWTSTTSPRPRCGCGASTRRCGSGTASRARPAIRGGPKDLAWLHPSGREMTGDDWHDDEPGGGRHVRLRRSAALPRPARRAAGGQVVHDLAQLRRTDRSQVELPENDWVQGRRGRALHRLQAPGRHPGEGRRPALPRQPLPCSSCARPEAPRARTQSRRPSHSKQCSGRPVDP